MADDALVGRSDRRWEQREIALGGLNVATPREFMENDSFELLPTTLSLFGRPDASLREILSTPAATY